MKILDCSENDFFHSAIEDDSSVFKNDYIQEWLKNKNKEVLVEVVQTPLHLLSGWNIDSNSGSILHESKKFFSIEGIRVSTNWGKVSNWEQPIINQPEIGYLGFLAKKINGILHFLVQAKIEPGNVNKVQLSPTLQATKSNYSQVHQGRKPLFLEYFNGEKTVSVLLDQLQSEQGARFLKKRNRNIIVEVKLDEILDIPENFIWMTIGQLKKMMRMDNAVNMDSRTVLSGISYGTTTNDELNRIISEYADYPLNLPMVISAIEADGAFRSFKYILSWITDCKAKYELTVARIPLNLVRDWKYNDYEFSHKDKKYFSVIGVDVNIGNREVVSWSQPMIKPLQEGLIGFLVKKINGKYHFLVQAKLEAGNLDIIELAPTVQCLTGNYRVGESEYSVEYINEFLNAPKGNVIFSTLQSEEGGRFYHEQNRNMIVEVGDDFDLEVSSQYCWFSLNQMLKLIEFNNYFNIAARNLISSIEYVMDNKKT